MKSNVNIIKSPLNYTGGKHRLLPQILPLLPITECFLDLFAGGATVAINMNANKIIINDINTKVIELFEWLYSQDSVDVIEQVKKTAEEYMLSDTAANGYAHYGCDSSEGLSKFNKEGFIELRKRYNAKPSPLLLYTLIIFSFNNQIRFNNSGGYNLPPGKRDFNQSMQLKLTSFMNSLKTKESVVFSSQDFRSIDLDTLPSDTLIYCDPPYIITTASYNENGAWNTADEYALLSFLDRVDGSGFKFALSNVIEAKNQENKILKEWINDNQYICHMLNQSYANSNYQRKNKTAPSIEVLVTNYTSDL